MAHGIDRIRIAAFAFFIAIAATSATAAPGDLDATFGTGGTMTLGLGHSYDFTQSMLRLPDGRFVVVGESDNGVYNDLGIAVFTAAGDVDTTFGIYGHVTARIGKSTVAVRKVARDATGRLLVTGWATDSGATYVSMFVTRFLPDGTLDASFGNGGVAFIDFGNPSGAYDLVVQADGKVVVGGYGYVGNSKFAMARLNANGTLDTTFNSTGMRIDAIGGFQDQCRQVLLQPDGKILCIGNTGDGVDVGNLVALRLDTSGALDPAFGSGGIAVGASGLAYAGTLQTDGKILLAGTLTVNPGCVPECFTTARVARLNGDGSPDLAFNSTGFVDLPRLDGSSPGTGLNGDIAYSILALGTGQILVGVQYQDIAFVYRVGLVRLNAGGSLDTSFGPASAVPGSALFTSFGAALVSGIADVGGAYVFTISAPFTAGDITTDFGLVRVTGVGGLDLTFGGGSGVASLDFENGSDGGIVALALQPDGKIVVGGQGNSPGFLAARFLPTGQRDASFGIGGRALYDFGDPANALNAVAVQPDGKILLGGYYNNAGVLNGAIIRVNANGSVDTTFGTAGLVTLAPGGTDTFGVARLALQPDGRIVATGTLTRTNHNTAVWRVNADGSLDNTFGTGGLSEQDFGSGGDDEPLALALQSDGRILIAGYANPTGDHRAWLAARYNANGSLDNTFATSGTYINDVTGAEALLFSMAVQADGKIVASGYATQLGAFAGGLVRLNADGSPDPTFPIQLYSQAPSQVVFGAVALDATGMYVTGLQQPQGESIPSTILFRYKSDGTLDPALPTTPLQLGPNGSGMRVMVRQPDGKLLTGGQILGAPAGMFGLARFLPVTPAPSSISGNGALTQSISVGSAFNALQVTVKDGLGVGIPGLAVTFTAPAIGPSAIVAPVTAITDVNGIATANATANGFYGTYNVIASVSGLGTTVTFTLTNLGADASLGATQLGFGNKDINATASSPPIAIRNIGNVPLTIASIVATGAGFGVVSSCPPTLVPLASCSITVTFLPTTEGHRTGQVTILSNGVVSPRTILLDGTGIDLSNPLGDADGDGIPNGVESSVNTNPRNKDNNVFGDARLFVMQQYRDFLSREGDTAGILGWIALLNTGAYDRLQVIDAFLSSQEFSGFVAPVVRLYFATFLRVPDYDGLTFNASLVRAGTLTVVQLADFFTQSPEFQATYGALNDTQFVTLLYNNVLGRAPDTAGLDGWLALLAGGYTRGQVLVGFSESTEYQANTANEVFVTMMYAGMLRRTPEPNGFNGWVGFLDSATLTRTQVINGFFLSIEYHNRFLP